jgi:hypothetical protein
VAETKSKFCRNWLKLLEASRTGFKQAETRINQAAHILKWQKLAEPGSTGFKMAETGRTRQHKDKRGRNQQKPLRNWQHSF